MTKSRRGGLLAAAAPASVHHAPSVRHNAWEDVADLCAAYGLVLDDWQEEVLRAGLGERADGRWAARQVGISTPRQNGKTMLIVARVLAGLLLFDERVIIVSAHRQDTARETFFRLVQIIEDNPEIDELVDFIARSEMREFIRMKSGQEVRFKARSSGSGRGFSCDCLMLDEAQILGSAAWSAILPTMSARPNPQVWLLGTPPTESDDGEVFTRIRSAGIEGRASQVAYLEWSASPDDDPSAVETWAKANPAFGLRIHRDAIQAEFETMSREQFAEERLGIWHGDGQYRPVISPELWRNSFDVATDGVRPDAIAVDMSHAGEISVAACWRNGELAHAEEIWAGNNSMAAVEWIASRVNKRMPVVVDNASPAAALVPDLKAQRLNVFQTSAWDMAKASQMAVNRINTASLTHGGQDAVTDALKGARKRPIRDAGGWGWDRRDESVNIAPLVAWTLAAYGAVTFTRKTSGNRTSRGREAVLL